eukprot:TRINITY_DN1806_c0_g1_i13.p1 TRINITY_DN1806_c0_g1~~TRINITY_DN1806_c0_g1_i13.p1  ORF type:complete len:223 (+),score=25.41 TRINITY_DN1806_c0_g1_i13:95-763(+)
MADVSKFELTKQGAEARIYTGQFLGQPVIVKERFSKGYRHPDLDAMLRKDRHRAECRALVKCQSLGVPVPTLYLCDGETSTIIMQRLEQAITVRDKINALLSEKATQELVSIAESIGNLVAKLHVGGLIHGDITTSNIMIDEPSGKLYFIDFGLSFQEGSPEDKGVDLYVLERALISTHPNTEYVFQAILDAYTKACGNQGKEIMKKFEEIRMRGRKRTMVG